MHNRNGIATQHALNVLWLQLTDSDNVRTMISIRDSPEVRQPRFIDEAPDLDANISASQRGVHDVNREKEAGITTHCYSMHPLSNAL